MKFLDLRDQFIQLSNEQNISIESASDEVNKLITMTAKRWRECADDEIEGFTPDLSRWDFIKETLPDVPGSNITHSPINNDGWLAAGRYICQHLAQQYPDRIVGNFAAGGGRTTPSGSIGFGIDYPQDRWRQRARDFVIVCEILAEMAGECELLAEVSIPKNHNPSPTDDSKSTKVWSTLMQLKEIAGKLDLPPSARRRKIEPELKTLGSELEKLGTRFRVRLDTMDSAYRKKFLK